MSSTLTVSTTSEKRIREIWCAFSLFWGDELKLSALNLPSSRPSHAKFGYNPAMTQVSRRRFLKTALALGVSSVGATVYGWTGAHSFQISTHSVALERLKSPLKLVQLSDLHFGPWHGEDAVGSWVTAALEQGPDLIVITGDLVDRACSFEREAKLVLELSRLKAPLGVYAVLGNHDYFRRNGTREAGVGHLVAALEGVGIRYLTNAGVQIRPDLHLAGVDDLWMGVVDLGKALEQALQESATLLLSHNPDLLPDVPSSVGLTLSGHTHGGQIRAPFGVGLYSISKFGERFQMGLVSSDPRADGSTAQGFVSRGLGTTGPPLRTFCPAEVIVLELEPT